MASVVQVWRENRITFIVILALIAGFLALRSTPSEIGSTQAFLESLSQGEPTVAYFYSNF
jgi:hypothetical protein